MKVDDRNRIWEEAALMVGLGVVAVSDRSRRKRYDNRIEGVISGLVTSAEYAMSPGGVDAASVRVVAVKVDMSESSGRFRGSGVAIEVFGTGDVKQSGDVAEPVQRALESAKTLLSSSLSLDGVPSPTRSTSMEVMSVVADRNYDSPSSEVLLGALAAMGPSDAIVLVDNSAPAFIQAHLAAFDPATGVASSDTGWSLEYREQDSGSLFKTRLDDTASTFRMFTLWHANDPAWKSAADWQPFTT